MEALTALKCWHCGSEEIVVDDGEYVCRRCGTVLGPVHQPARLTRLNPTTRRLLNRAMRMNGAGNTGNLQASISKTRSQRGNGEDMANYTKRLARALIGTGNFSEEEAGRLAERLHEIFKVMNKNGHPIPKPETVVEVYRAMVSGKYNERGRKYDIHIAGALREALVALNLWRPLVKSAASLLYAEPSDGFMENAVKYCEELYEFLTSSGIQAWKFPMYIAIAAVAISKAEQYTRNTEELKKLTQGYLAAYGYAKVYELLNLGEFMQKIKGSAGNSETKAQ
jgi:hypothetical protein